MQQNFETVFKQLIGDEGGYGDDYRDSGGPTKYGVTLVDLRIWRKNQNLTARDVQAMKLDEAHAIFKHRYWDVLHGDDLPPGLDYAVTDFGYNSGNTRAAKLLQNMLGLEEDGIVGLRTIDAACKACDPAFIQEYQDRRLAMLETFRGWGVFGNGWTDRVEHVEAASLQLYNLHPHGPEVAASGLTLPPPAPQARADQVPASSPATRAGGLTGASALMTGMSDAANQLAPLSHTLKVAEYAFAGLTMLGAMVGLYIAYRNLSKG